MSHSAEEQWNQRYRGDEYFYGTEPNDFLREHIALIPDGPVLCIADGEGRNSVFVASLGFDTSSVDISSSGVNKTRLLAAERGVVVDAQVGDLAVFDVGTSKWSAIVSIFCHLPQVLRGDVHRRIADGLVPGGIVLLEAYTVNQIGRGTGGPQVPELLMSEESLREEFSGLEIIYLAETERDVREGAGHAGLASVVQLIARKTI